jgi:tRNA pseudouridine38-40 synthase
LNTVRLTVEYDGTDFSGFQAQPSVRTVAGEIEAALARLFSDDIKVTGAGRTDAGVHATGQVVSFTAGARFPFERLLLALNALLPDDLSVREAAIAGDGFSARFAARERTYVYAILNRPARSAVLARYAWHVAGTLDLGAMRAAAEHLIGEHDFRSFATVAPEISSTRTVGRLEIAPAGQVVRLEIAADGFLRHMVRVIVGTLVECGQGRRPPSDLPRVLAARDRTAAGHTAPAAGLCLAGVRYADGYDSYAEAPAFGPAAALDGARAFP